MFGAFPLVHSAEIPDDNTYLQGKSFFEKISFWKKWKKDKNTQKMPKTYQQWEKISASEPVRERENPRVEPEPNKKLTKVLPKEAQFVRYNNPPGEAETDLSQIKHSLTVNSAGVINETFDKMAYVSYFYYPSYNQLSSKLFVLPLDKTKTRMERVKNANILKASRENNFEINMDFLKEDYYSTLTILDWSLNSDFILVKNKIGSSSSGLFRTTLYKVTIDEDCENLSYKKIDFEKQIKKYWENKTDIVLNLYRWDIKPLGFNEENEEEVIAYAWAWDKNNKKIFLGTWGANLTTYEVYFISEEMLPYSIANHGIILRYSLP